MSFWSIFNPDSCFKYPARDFFCIALRGEQKVGGSWNQPSSQVASSLLRDFHFQTPSIPLGLWFWMQMQMSITSCLERDTSDTWTVISMWAIRDCQKNTGDFASRDQKSCAPPLSFGSPLTSCPCPWDPSQLLTLHWGYLYDHNISIMRYQLCMCSARFAIAGTFVAF